MGQRLGRSLVGATKATATGFELISMLVSLGVEWTGPTEAQFVPVVGLDEPSKKVLVPLWPHVLIRGQRIEVRTTDLTPIVGTAPTIAAEMIHLTDPADPATSGQAAIQATWPFALRAVQVSLPATGSPGGATGSQLPQVFSGKIQMSLLDAPEQGLVYEEDYFVDVNADGPAAPGGV